MVPFYDLKVVRNLYFRILVRVRSMNLFEDEAPWQKYQSEIVTVYE